MPDCRSAASILLAVSGIFGVCCFDGRPVDRALVSGMSETLAHDGRDGEGVAVEGSSAIGCRLLRGSADAARAAQPVHTASGARVVFDGRLHNRSELISELRNLCDISTATSDAGLAAASYAIGGPAFATRLLGDFAVAVLDVRARRVVLARDGMGIRPLYYRRTPSSVLFGSHIKTVTVDPAFEVRPDNQLLAELLLRRAHRRACDNATLFAGVSQVPPGHVAVFTSSGTQLHRYWDFDRRRQDSARSFDDCAHEFRHLFERAVSRRLTSTHPTAIAVSGGLDSSSIFCAASRATARPVVGLTYTPHDGSASDESAFVTDVERACGKAIRHVDAPAEGLLYESAAIVRAAEAPMLNGQWFRGHRLLNAVTAAGARTLLTGHWGDQLLFDQAYLVDLLRTGAWRTLGAHLREYPRWFPDARAGEFLIQFGSDVLEYALPRWLRSTVRAAKRRVNDPEPWDDWFTDRFRQEPRPDVFDHAAGAPALACALYREVRSQYHHLCLEWNAKVGASYGVDIAFPFLDRDLVEFLIGVPGTVLARDGAPKALLRESLKGLAPDTILRRRAKAHFTEAVNRSTRQDFAALLKMLGPTSLVVELGYVDASKLARGLAAAGPALETSSTSIVSWRVTAVAALELWLRQFVEVPPDTGREETAWQRTSLASAQ